MLKIARKLELKESKEGKARRDKKKVFLIDQCKEIEENNRMGKTRNLFKNKIPREHFMQRWAE